MPKTVVDPVRWQPPGVQPLLTPPQPMPATQIIRMSGPAPKDIVADAAGYLWTGISDGRIVRISPDGSEQCVVATTEHAPLGMHVAHDGRILICCRDTVLALEPATGEFEPLVAHVDGPPMIFCCSVTESSDGTVYFSESTSRFTYEDATAAALEGRQTGRVFRRDVDGKVTTIARGLAFANGVTLTADESELIVAESSGRRLTSIALRGPFAGQRVPLIEELPGLPENISTGNDGKIWVALPSSRNLLVEWLFPRDPLIRKILWHLPTAMLNRRGSGPWVVAIDPSTGGVLANIHGRHPKLSAVTGVVESGGHLWLSGSGTSAIGRIPLSSMTISTCARGVLDHK